MQQLFDGLSARERQITRELVSNGGGNREIGERLGLAEKTVKNAFTRILAKLGADSRADVIALAYKSGFATTPATKTVPVRVYLDDGGQIPRRESAGAAGMDLRSTEDKEILPGELGVVGTGLHVEIPPGYEMMIRPRSGLSFKHRLLLINSPGTIDSDYRGEIKVGLLNLGTDGYTISKGERIAQAFINPVINAEWEEVEELEFLTGTVRGSGGFGSTGKK